MDWNVKQVGTDVIFEVKVQPGAKKNEIFGLWGSALKMKIAAKPESGAANRECIRYLAKVFQVPQKQIFIIRGEFGRSKVVRISGISKEKVLSIII